MPSFQNLLKGIKAEIREIDVQGTKALLDQPVPPVVIDVREQDEYVQGFIPGAVWIPRGFLEQKIEDAVPDRAAPIVIYCAGGTRSALAVRSLVELGYTNVTSMAGGFGAWKRTGLPWKAPTVLTREQEQRYSRHTLLPEVGVKGQIKLLEGRVLCIGAGGLGSPSSLYLAAAGVGTLGVIDDDVVDATNLQRQILHSLDRVGTPKVDSAEKTIKGLNPDVVVRKHKARLTSDNVMEILAGYDVIVDGADNFQTRYLVNDAALRLGKPVVHASIFRFEGQITVFPANGAPCYRCLYPEPPPPEEAPAVVPGGRRARRVAGDHGRPAGDRDRQAPARAWHHARRPPRGLRRAQDPVPRAQAAARSEMSDLWRGRGSLEDPADRLRPVLRR
jgi:molybdopterin/thiamine biosynthesis adenylyltransferase/rhodanese-related sulfurtransferase